MNKTKVIIVDDHQIVRDGLNVLLMAIDDITVTYEASDWNELKMVLKKQLPHVLLLDIGLPGISGIEIAKKLRVEHPEIGIIMLTANIEEDVIFDSIEAGVKGFLPKDTGRDELIQAIRSVREGHDYFSDQISKIVMESYVRQVKKGDKEFQVRKVSLTERETEIVRLLVDGLTHKEIADRLNISARTVESHRNNIMQKFEFRTMMDLVKYAIKNKIVEI